MMHEQIIPRARKLWPTIRKMALKHKADPKLLLALGCVLSGLEIIYASDESSKTAGVIPLPPHTAERAAEHLARASYDLEHEKTSIEFAAAFLGRLLKAFVLPRVAAAAYVAGPEAVQRAGGKVPDDFETQRIVRDVMLVFGWLQAHLSEVVEKPPIRRQCLTPSTITGSERHEAVMGAGTSTGASAPTTTISVPSWQLVALPAEWHEAVVLEPSAVAIVEHLATRLGLMFRRDDEQRTVYVGRMENDDLVTRQVRGRLVLPVVGCTAAHNASISAARGIDLAVPCGSPVRAAGSGTVVLSERGTGTSTAVETPHQVLVRLDNPFVYRGRDHLYLSYKYLSRLRFQVPLGSAEGVRVEQGDLLGWSGIAGRVPLLHFAVQWDRAGTVYVPPFALAGYFGWEQRG